MAKAGFQCVIRDHPDRTQRAAASAAIFRICIEGSCGGRSGPVDCVDDCLEQRKAAGRQADTGADHDAVILCGFQLPLPRRDSRKGSRSFSDGFRLRSRVYGQAWPARNSILDVGIGRLIRNDSRS